MATKTRELKLTLTPSQGTINFFYAFVNGKKVISSNGTVAREWTGKVSESEVQIKVRVSGIGKAQYIAVIDLPGTVKDQKLTLTLSGGYNEFELKI